MIDFKLERGMIVRMNNGDKAEVLKTDCVLTEPVICYHIRDRFVFHTRPENIKGIWEEPKPKRLCYRNKAGILFLLNTDELINSLADLERFPCALDEV